MRLVFKLARCVSAAIAVWLGASAAYAATPGAGPATQTVPRQPAGQTAQDVSIDCDIFADGVHEVPLVVVTSPPPAATLPPDDMVIQGAAVDCHVDIGAGINRVAVFLGRREAGGILLGEAALRAPSPISILPADQYAASSGFLFKGQAPLKAGEMNELYIYARSELTNIETSVMLPVVGAGSAAAPPPKPADSPADSPPAPGPPPAAEPAPTAAPPEQDVPPAAEAPVEEPPAEEPPPTE
jgi:hypothetical protein